MNKLQSSEKQVNAYVNVLAVFAVDSSWTTLHYGDGTMKTFRVSGIASNDVLHVKGDISVTKVVFGKTVTGLESELFSGCIMLRDVIMHSGMWQFGNGVFDGCTALANISFS